MVTVAHLKFELSIYRRNDHHGGGLFSINLVKYLREGEPKINAEIDVICVWKNSFEKVSNFRRWDYFLHPKF